MTVSTDPFATYKLLSTELESKGYHVSTEYQDGSLFATYTSPGGKVWHTPAARIRYPFSNETARRLSRDKAASYAFAKSKGVPIPFTLQIEHHEFLDDKELEKTVQGYAPLIAKPNNSSLSRGLTLNITTVDDLKAAIRSARLVRESDVLVQQQVSGVEVRFVVLRGKVKAALLRQTPQVVGDGAKTVMTLIEEENLARQSLVFPYISYPQLTGEIIDETYLHDQRILEKGEILELSKATMIRNGCSVYNVLDQVHPSYIEEIETFIEDIDTSFLVADFLINDYSVPCRNDNHWFLEFNGSPVLKLCYGCRDGRMFDIVPLLSDLIDETLK